ncbi:sugar ABC transporter substrate-binding protein [Lichenihabitans sp. Uapishka_5]|uniref:sugar ABC transporter substrate-binding protein n=1 Tax=Lichenihabitans sp. Uapishka_5 TaxID=3037302 RepID=UPI0029E7DD36|nr:sugar ABC transporter substrate-binding protein [Lichenihabitans sp. Uapishka_5]MDX7952337.1 sugar ABC transporter substrate-binding protein [Lichenihabitans sp. Uapishka_5]
MRAKLLMSAALVALSTAGMARSASATTIGVTMDKFDDNFLTSVRNAIEAEAKAKGATVQAEDANDDTSKQISQIQNFIAQKVDAIIVNAVDTSATPKMTQLAVAAKIPLVYVNRKPEDKTLPAGVSFVGSNEKVSGVLEAEELVKCMKVKGNLVIMQGQLSNNAALDRTADVEEVVAKNPDIKIVQKQTAEWDRNKAIDLMNNWITGGDKINGVAANNDEMAIGAILALKQAGVDPKTMCIGGIDATADGLAEVANGNMYVTVFQNSKGQGKGAVDTALALIKGEKVPSFVDVPFEKVTKDNYKNYAQ